jgi:hypothetical protein
MKKRSEETTPEKVIKPISKPDSKAETKPTANIADEIDLLDIGTSTPTNTKPTTQPTTNTNNSQSQKDSGDLLDLVFGGSTTNTTKTTSNNTSTSGGLGDDLFSFGQSTVETSTPVPYDVKSSYFIC